MPGGFHQHRRHLGDRDRMIKHLGQLRPPDKDSYKTRTKAALHCKNEVSKSRSRPLCLHLTGSSTLLLVLFHQIMWHNAA